MKIESLEEAIIIKALTVNFCKRCPHRSVTRHIANCDDCFVEAIEELANESYVYWEKVENEEGAE